MTFAPAEAEKSTKNAMVLRATERFAAALKMFIEETIVEDNDFAS